MAAQPLKPSATSGGKGKKATSSTVDSVLEERQKQVDALQRQCRAVEEMLMVCMEQQQRALNGIALNEARMASTAAQLETEAQTIDENYAAMLQQYKQMESQLQVKRKQRLDTVADLKQDVERLERQLQRLDEEKRQELMEVTAAVELQRRKMESLALELGTQLKQLLEEQSDGQQREK